MNNWCLTICLVVLIAVVVSGAPKAKSLEENIKILRKVDIKSVLKNDRIIWNYIQCVCDEKPCTSEGAAVKESWKEGLDKGCDNCSEEEKIKIKQLIKHIYLNKREWYDKLVNHLDKDMKLREKYQKYIDEIVADKSIQV